MGEFETGGLYVCVKETGEDFSAEVEKVGLGGKGVELEREVGEVGDIGVEFFFIKEGDDVSVVHG